MRKLLLPLILVVFQISALQAQIENIQYNQIPRIDGLNRNNITSVLKDSRGFMWFGSKSGLSRYDGYKFLNYRYNENDTTSISGNFIFGINEDASGNLWIATQEGLNRYNRKEETFTRFSHLTHLKPGESSWMIITSQGKDNTIWCSFWSTTVLQFDIKKEEYSLVQLKTEEPDGVFDEPFSSFYEDGSGALWAGSHGGGLYKFDLANNNKLIAHYTSGSNTGKRISNDTVWTIFEDNKGDIWIGTDGGLNRISTAKGTGMSETITHFVHDPDNPHSISHNSIMAISEDASGDLWMRTFNGVNTYNRETGEFNVWNHEDIGIYSLETFLALHTLFIDDEGLIWFGLINGGISSIKEHNNKFNLIQHDPDNPNSINNNYVTGILQDPSGVLWVGTEDGLNRRIPGKDPGDDPTWVYYEHDPKNPHSIGSNRIRTIYRDRQETLWVGTVNGGLNKFIDSGNRKGHFEHYNFDTIDHQYHNTVDLILEDTSW